MQNQIQKKEKQEVNGKTQRREMYKKKKLINKKVFLLFFY